MSNVLIIGLDFLSEKIINSIKKTDCVVYGFDFDVDKIELFKSKNLINNSISIILNDLLKKSDYVILNIEYSKYKNVLKLLPFTKNDCLILNVNCLKENDNEIKKLMKNRMENFMPCNFLLFPKEVVLNYDKETTMNLILKTSNFFHEIGVKTSVLDANENDKIFCNLYQMPYLFEYTLFKNSEYHFINEANDYDKYNFFFDDMILNKKNILEKIRLFISNMPDLNNDNSIGELLKNNKLDSSKSLKTLKTEVNNSVVLKIIFEKIFLKSFVDRASEFYLNFKYLNFDYIDYDMKSVEEYCLGNFENIKVSMMIMKEKVISLSSFLQFDGISLDKKHIQEFLNK